MTQAVNSRPVTAVARFRSQATPYEICGGQSDTETGFSSSNSVLQHCSHSSVTDAMLTLQLIASLNNTHTRTHIRNIPSIMCDLVPDLVPRHFSHDRLQSRISWHYQTWILKLPKNAQCCVTFCCIDLTLTNVDVTSNAPAWDVSLSVLLLLTL
jgi:hypothetical protein